METTLHFDARQIFGLSLQIICQGFWTGLAFDQKELESTAQVQNNIPDYTFTLTNVKQYSATGNIKFILKMSEAVNINDGTVDVGMVLDGLNTSATPNTAFQNVYRATVDENALLKLNEMPSEDGRPRAEIVFSSQLAKLGGLFTPYVRKRIASGFLWSITQGVNIPMKSTETDEVIPTNTFGIFRTDSEVDNLEIFSDEYSFFCFVIGNPIPRIDVFVTYENGTQSGVQPVPSSSSGRAFDSFLYITIHKEQFRNGGNFTCRVTLNQETQTKEIMFLFRNAEQCAIDWKRTGIVGQTNESDIVRCTASGIPSPNVALDLYHSGGPDLLLTGKFQVSNTTIEHTISVNLTISPPNPDIHTLVCECRQGIYFGRNQNGTQEIVLYPGRQSNYTLYSELNSYRKSRP